MNERGGSPALAAKGLERFYPSGEGRLEVLRGVDLSIARGEIAAIVGPSGSGKSTLLHCLGGLDKPSAGQVSVGGTDLSKLDEQRLASVRNRHIGFVFQFHHLLPDFSALENVMLPLLISGAEEEAAEQRAHSLLGEVGLMERAQHAPSELSGGEQQRVAVARALANEPTVVLADEPSGNLDLAASLALHNLLEQLRDRRGATFVIATHDPELAGRADRVLAIREGRLDIVDRDDPASWTSPKGAEAVS